MKILKYTSDKIASIVNGKFLQNSCPSEIDHLLLDSRKINSPETSIFFAIKGKHHDGHKFIPEAYQKGVRNFVVNAKEASSVNIKNLSKSNIIQVKNTLQALQLLASVHRENFNIPVIGITGSNGKTMIKEWLFQLLRQDKHIVRSPKSYNSQVGVPLSVWQMNNEHKLAIFEAGISQTGEMQNLANIVKPTIGIFTNIGQAHDEGFSTAQEKISEKFLFFKTCNMLIYCKDHLPSQNTVKYVFTWSRQDDADLNIINTIIKNNRTNIEAMFKDTFVRISIPFTDPASVENAIHCWCIMIYLGYDNEVIRKRMLKLNHVAMRLQLKAGINNCTIINDSYNSDFLSLNIALDLLAQQQQHKNKTLILSDILQSGKNESDLYKKVAEMINKKGVTQLIGIGKAITRQESSFKIRKSFYPDTSSFLKSLNVSEFKDEAVLIKGARSFEFEKISIMLQQKDHETVLEINLNAIIHNLNFYRSQLNEGTKIMAMVKAFSYGSGSYEIANVLQYHHTDYLTVAYADEAVELRGAGITLPIMIMNPERQSFDTIIRNNLEPEIYSFNILNNFIERLNAFNISELKLPYPVHLKIDTGMNRLGFKYDELDELIKKLKCHENLIQIKSVFSHLVSSDNAAHDSFTKEQISLFESACTRFSKEFHYSFLKHILNSSGIVRFPEAQMDMVRLGIGLYGLDSSKEAQSKLQNVSTLKTTISQIKKIKKNESIGYNRSYVATKDMQVATVGIGYADGLDRKLGNGKGKMLVGECYVPIVGNICMDMCMLDVTGIPANEGDEVLVFGESYTVNEMADDLGTISYEILTSISQRVKRVYYHE